MRIVLLTAAILAAFTFAACGDDDDEDVGDDSTRQPTATTDGSGGGGGANIELVAADFQFAPTELNLAAGETYTVTFINTGEAKHNFMIDDLDVSEDVDANGEVTFDFTAPDHDVSFHCHYHQDAMQGTIVIGDSASTDDDDEGGDIDGGGYGY